VSHPEPATGDPHRLAAPPVAAGLETQGAYASPEVPRSSEAGGEPAPPSISETVAQQIGGVRGMAESAVPVVVFVIANVATELRTALWAAVGSAALLALVRLVRRESVRHAVNGLIGVAFAAMIAAKTGRAENFYLPGIAMNGLYAVGFAVSAVIRRPIVGYAWALITGGSSDWRERPRLVRAYSLLTWMWAGVFLLRGGVQLVLYLLGMPNALGVVRIAGIGLYAAALAFTVWAGRRAVAADQIDPDARAVAPA